MVPLSVFSMAITSVGALMGNQTFGVRNDDVRLYK